MNVAYIIKELVTRRQVEDLKQHDPRAAAEAKIKRLMNALGDEGFMPKATMQHFCLQNRLAGAGNGGCRDIEGSYNKDRRSLDDEKPGQRPQWPQNSKGGRPHGYDNRYEEGPSATHI